jgi:hypothetical protein
LRREGEANPGGVASVGLGECWRRLYEACSFLDDEGELRRKVEVYGSKAVRECAEVVIPQALSDPCLKELGRAAPWEAKELEEKLEERLLKARSLLEPKPLDFYVDCPGEVFSDEELRAHLTVKNPNVERVNAVVEVGGDFEPVGAFQGSLVIPPLSSRSFEVVLRPRGKGRRRLLVRVKDPFSTRQEEYFVEVKEYRAELEASLEMPREIVLGESFKVVYKLRNKGSVDLEVEVPNPFNPEDKTVLTLRPGEEAVREFTGKLEEVVERFQAPALVYRDLLRGREHELPFKPVEIEVERRIEKAKEERRGERERRELREEREVPATLEDVLSEASKHFLAGLAGYVVGSFFKEKVEYPKPVYVEGVPYATKEDVTVIFSDRTSVVEEDMGDYILIRKASLEEVVRAVTAGGAKNLLGDFRVRVQSKLESWRPPFAPDSRLEWRQILSPEDSLRELAKELRVDFRKVEGLPGNFCLEYDYREPGLLGKSLLKVYVGGCVRLKKLYQEGRDSKALTIDEALEELGLKDLKTKERAIIVLASPTGWSPASIETARSVSGKTLYLLVDLKTGEMYYNSGEGLLVDLASELASRPAPLPLTDDVVRLDRELLDGKIPEEFYRKKIEELLRAR